MTAPPPKFSARQQSIQTLAAVTAAAMGAVCGSFISTAGTFYGAVLGTAAFGSLVSGTAQWGYGHLFHHASRHMPAVNARRVRWGAAVAAAGLGGCLVVVTAFEAASGQTLHAATTGSKESGGTTLGTTLGNPVRPSVVPQRTGQGHPSPSGSAAMPSGAATVSPTPSATVTDPSGNPSASPDPAAPTSTPPSVFTPTGASPTQPAPAQTAPTGATQ